MYIIYIGARVRERGTRCARKSLFQAKGPLVMKKPRADVA